MKQIEIKKFFEKNGALFFSERRLGKRRPECQAFTAFILTILFSLLVSFFFHIFPSIVNKGDFQVVSASSFAKESGIAIDADLKMNFPDDVVEALENGIPLMLAVEAQVLRERFLWRDYIIKQSIQLFELRYHPLTNVHEVKNVATNERYAFNGRQDAMAVLGTIRGAHLIDKENLARNQQYFIQMRISLDISHLPAELRQIASLSSSWRLESAWYRWEVNDKPRTREKIAEVEQLDLTLALKRRSKMPEPPPELDDVTTEEPLAPKEPLAKKGPSANKKPSAQVVSSDNTKPAADTVEDDLTSSINTQKNDESSVVDKESSVNSSSSNELSPMNESSVTTKESVK